MRGNQNQKTGKARSGIKQGLALVLLCLMALGLVGCGDAGAEEMTTIGVTLSGGSGKTTVQSPAVLEEQADGTLLATIVWSSPHYVYMDVDGQRYEPIQTEGNATFRIPVVLDAEMPVQACTEAMSMPHVIDYTLYFDSSTLSGGK